MASSIINSDDGLVSGTSGIKTTGGDDGVLNIQSNGSTVVAVDGSGVSVTGTLSSSGGYGAVSATTLTVNSNNISADNSLGFRNRIINGDMRIDQRNAGASVTVTTIAYSVDRWLPQENNGSTVTAQQSTTVPSGFTNSLLLTASTGATSASGEVARLLQRIEGFNWSDLGYGAAGAKTVTVSFWVRSSVTGTYCFGFMNNAQNRAYASEYSISVADTWEYKTITIAGDTSGTWLTTNGTGIICLWDLGSGSDFNQSAGSWSGTNDWKTSNQVDWVGTTGATFYITGVQLEVGSVATPFERRDYGRELIMCQRYLPVLPGATSYVAGYNSSASQVYIPVPFPVTARVAPTGISTTLSSVVFISATGYAVTALDFIASSTQTCLIRATTAQPLTANNGNMLQTSGAIFFTGCEL
jgi:hypothetical protein